MDSLRVSMAHWRRSLFSWAAAAFHWSKVVESTVRVREFSSGCGVGVCPSGYSLISREMIRCPVNGMPRSEDSQLLSVLGIVPV